MLSHVEFSFAAFFNFIELAENYVNELSWQRVPPTSSLLKSFVFSAPLRFLCTLSIVVGVVAIRLI